MKKNPEIASNLFEKAKEQAKENRETIKKLSEEK